MGEDIWIMSALMENSEWGKKWDRLKYLSFFVLFLMLLNEIRKNFPPKRLPNSMKSVILRRLQRASYQNTRFSDEALMSPKSYLSKEGTPHFYKWRVKIFFQLSNRRIESPFKSGNDSNEAWEFSCLSTTYKKQVVFYKKQAKCPPHTDTQNKNKVQVTAR